MRPLRAEGRGGGGARRVPGELAVAEPFFEDLIAAESVIPDVNGDGGPVGVAIEMDIDAGFAEQGERVVTGSRVRDCDAPARAASFSRSAYAPGAFGGKAATGHDGAALALVSPSGGDLESFVEVGVEREPEGGEKGPFCGRLMEDSASRSSARRRPRLAEWISRSAVGGSGMRGQSPSRAPAFSIR